MSITITSEAFKAGETIPKLYTGEDEDHSPALVMERCAGRGEGISPDLRRSRCADGRALGALGESYKIPADKKSLAAAIPRQAAPRDSQRCAARGELVSQRQHRLPRPDASAWPRRPSLPFQALRPRPAARPPAGTRQTLTAMEGDIRESEIIGTYQR